MGKNKGKKKQQKDDAAESGSQPGAGPSTSTSGGQGKKKQQKDDAAASGSQPGAGPSTSTSGGQGKKKQQKGDAAASGSQPGAGPSTSTSGGQGVPAQPQRDQPPRRGGGEQAGQDWRGRGQGQQGGGQEGHGADQDRQGRGQGQQGGGQEGRGRGQDGRGRGQDGRGRGQDGRGRGQDGRGGGQGGTGRGSAELGQGDMSGQEYRGDSQERGAWGGRGRGQGRETSDRRESGAVQPQYEQRPRRDSGDQVGQGGDQSWRGRGQGHQGGQEFRGRGQDGRGRGQDGRGRGQGGRGRGQDGRGRGEEGSGRGSADREVVSVGADRRQGDISGQEYRGDGQGSRGTWGGRGRGQGRETDRRDSGPPSQPRDRPPPQQRGDERRTAPDPRQTGPSRSPSQASVASVSAGVSALQIPRKDEGDAEVVSKTRRTPGRQGRVIKVESNHLQLNLGSLKCAYHYDVAIDPDVPRKLMRPVIESWRRRFFPDRYPAFDGKKNLYTSAPLTNNLGDVFNEEIILQEDGREKIFKVQIKFANRVDMTPLRDMLQSPVTPQEAIQVVDIVLKMAPVVSCFPFGRSFFVRPTNGIIDLGEGMEMYHGFYQSAIRGWKPLLNVDVAHKAFPRNILVIDSLVELLTSFRRQIRREDLRSLDRYQEETLSKYIKGLRVTYEIPGHPGSRKNYKVNGLGDTPSRAIFDNNGQKISIKDYFARVKNHNLRYPDLPTLWVGSLQRQDKILLPLELCTVMEGQGVQRRMTENQTSKMIRHAATNTAIRKEKIMAGIDRSRYNQNPCVREFGFSVGHEFLKLDARVLNPPQMLYNNNQVVSVQKGVWRNGTFLNPVTISKWTIATVCQYAPRPDELNRMVEMFMGSGREVGMTFMERATEPYTAVGRRGYRDIETYFKSQKDKFDVIFVVVPDSGPEYSYVKKAAEVAIGCLTQCVKSGTVSRKMNTQTAVNILLKVNSKLNGRNHALSPNSKPPLLSRPIMIMGADVTHPGPLSTDIPSVAAVTASHDPKAFQYNITWRLQNPRTEIIEDLEAIVIEHLKFFYSKTKVKPEAILFLRDGVSEGQFAQVKHAEIRAIRSACKKLQQEGYEPKITFLVVQKRHHTRLFPLNPRDSQDKNCNVPAGTCVDTEIVHPFMQDFYLVSHASIQGVARPTKYVTLCDDNDLDNDQVEQLVYYLCHMFSRCNRSVSYPAPTYYAHLAAARAKVYIENDRLNMERLNDEMKKYQIKDEIRKGLPMFFV